jgi:hypothetical protein
MRHYLNGIEVAPRNILNIGVESDFTDRPEYLEVDTDRIILPRESLNIIQQHLATYGPFEGIPYQMVTNGGDILEYYVDLQDETLFRDYEIEVKIKRRKGKGYFFDRADGTTFELMAKKGVVFSTVDVDYIIIQDNAVETAIGLGVSIYVLTKDIIEQINALAQTINTIIDSVTPESGAGLTFDPAEIATLVVKALIQIGILVLTLVALIKMVQQFFELLFPKVRQFQAAKFKELCTKGCSYLGFQFSSTLLDSLPGLTCLPVPLVKDKDSFWDFLQNDLNFAFTKGYPTASDSTPTLGSLLTALENWFNARTTVRNGIVHLERRDYFQDLATQQLLPALKIQDKRSNEYRYNTEEIWKRYYIHYQVDFSDLFTVDFYDPTDAEYSTEPVLVGNQDLVSIRGLNEVNIPFALGVRKGGLNWLENFAKDFFEVADEIINALGGNGNYASQIEGRVGVMQVSQQFYSTTKALYIVGTKQPETYVDIMAAGKIYQNYHAINQIAVNDYKIFSDVPVRLSGTEFVNLLDNNFAVIDGVACEVLNIKFKDEQSSALITYKQPFDWADGKTTVLTIDS